MEHVIINEVYDISLMVIFHSYSPRWCLNHTTLPLTLWWRGNVPGSHHKDVYLAGCGCQNSHVAEFQLFTLNFDLGLKKDHPPSATCRKKRTTYHFAACHQPADVTTASNWA